MYVCVCMNVRTSVRMCTCLASYMYLCKHVGMYMTIVIQPFRFSAYDMFFCFRRFRATWQTVMYWWKWLHMSMTVQLLASLHISVKGSMSLHHRSFVSGTKNIFSCTELETVHGFH